MAGHYFDPGGRILGPKDLVCGSHHGTEFLLQTAVFEDGSRVSVCSACACEALRLGAVVVP